MNLCKNCRHYERAVKTNGLCNKYAVEVTNPITGALEKERIYHADFMRGDSGYCKREGKDFEQANRWTIFRNCEFYVPATSLLIILILWGIGFELVCVFVE